MTHALYAGSFDPITRGHLDIISKAMKTFDRVTIARGINPKKTPMFDTSHATYMIAYAMRDVLGVEFSQTPGFREDMRIIHDRALGSTQYADDTLTFTSIDGKVHIGFYEDIIPAYAARIGATHLVRGLRQVSDFDDEFKLHGIMRRIAPELTPVHILCDETFLHVSSSTAKELAKYGIDDLDWLVTPMVRDQLLAKSK